MLSTMENEMQLVGLVYCDLTSEAAEVAPAAPSAENLSLSCDFLPSAAPSWTPSLLMSAQGGWPCQ